MKRLRLALRAYPRRVRETEGDVLLGLAADLAGGGSSVNREALGLLRGGLVARAGALARAPWEEALARLAVPIAAAFAALLWGRAIQALSLAQPGWPGWGWLVTILAPLLALAGILARRRVPAALGALLLAALGVAQANSRPATTYQWFTGEIAWDIPGPYTASLSIVALGYAIPGALVLLAAAARLPRARGRARCSVALAWTAAGALAVALLGHREMTFWELHLDEISLLLVGYGVAVAGFAAVVMAGPARHDPAARLAALVAVATTLPGPVPLALGSLVLMPDPAVLPVLGLFALCYCAGLARGVAATARPRE